MSGWSEVGTKKDVKVHMVSANVGSGANRHASPKQQQIFDFIVKFKIDHDGNSPSVREIAAGCGVTTPSVIKYHLSALENQGAISRPVFGNARMIVVTGGQWIQPAHKVAQ